MRNLKVSTSPWRRESLRQREEEALPKALPKPHSIPVAMEVQSQRPVPHPFFPTHGAHLWITALSPNCSHHMFTAVPTCEKVGIIITSLLYIEN